MRKKPVNNEKGKWHMKKMTLSAVKVNCYCLTQFTISHDRKTSYVKNYAHQLAT